jgi:hypothetical protein
MHQLRAHRPFPTTHFLKNRGANTLKIRNHRLPDNDGRDSTFIASPNIGGIIQAQYLILHYTAGNSVGRNRHGISIEIDNAGQLIRSGGKWVSPLTRRSDPEHDVTFATHKNEPHGTPPSGWAAATMTANGTAPRTSSTFAVARAPNSPSLQAARCPLALKSTYWRATAYGGRLMGSVRQTA